MPGRKSLNYKVLMIFAPLLILTGALGFILPPQATPMSSEPAYNIFHLGAGFIGLLLIIFRYENPIRLFNIGFGLIDIYQVFASYAHIFPEQFFKWTRVDDILHAVVGIILVFIGLYGFMPLRKISTS
jgi:hypothetical protein